MPNVNHRYSSQSWTLDLSAQQSPLSRWTGRDILRKESFRLSLLGAESGVAPVVWLAGDRSCFEQLYQTIESYVQQGLSQPVLAPQSAFPVSPSDGEAEIAESARHTDPEQASDADQFSIEALGRLRHQLTYQASDSPSRQMQLSTVQLADLLDVLDQWQQQTSALPESRAGLSVVPGDATPKTSRTGFPTQGEFVIPLWGRVAASVAIATSIAGLGVYSILQSGPTQVASETTQAPSESPLAGDLAPGNLPAASSPGDLFGSFPSAEGPPITTQAESGLAFPDPLITPSSEDGLLLPVPSVVFPTSGELIPGILDSESDLDSTAESPALPDETSIASFDVGDDAKTEITTSPDTSIAAETATPTTVATTDDGLIDNGQPPSVTSGGNGQFTDDRFFNNGGEANPEAASGFPGSSVIAEEITPEDVKTEDAPLVVNPNDLSTPIDPNTPTNLSIPTEPSLTAEASSSVQTDASTASETIVATSPVAPAPPTSSPSELDLDPAFGSNASSQAGRDQALGESSNTASTSPAVAIASPAQSGASTTSSGASRARPDSSSTPVTEPLPTNTQSVAVENYLQSNWTPPFAQKQLQYRISVSSEGKLISVQPLPGTVKSSDFPKIGSTISGASGPVQSTLNVTVTTLGKVIVTVERESPAQ